MKLTKSKLKQFIKEELGSIKEWDTDPEEQDAMEYDGMYSEIEGWTNDILSRADMDEMRELHSFLDDMLGVSRSNNPYGTPRR